MVSKRELALLLGAACLVASAVAVGAGLAQAPAAERPPARPAASHDPGASRPPGGDFDLTEWELQLPVGAPGSTTTIKPAQLAGPTGYSDPPYFETDPASGGMAFWAPENGVTTPNSQFPRSELRQMTPDGRLAEWRVSARHTMTATVAVTRVTKKVCVGQVHLGTGGPSTLALAELFYSSDGRITVGVGKSPAGGQVIHPLGTVPIGRQWDYSITVDRGVIDVSVDGSTTSYDIPRSFDPYDVYFKAGAYNQSASASETDGARVVFSKLGLTKLVAGERGRLPRSLVRTPR